MSNESTLTFADAARAGAPQDLAHSAPLAAALIAEAVQRIEADGPLDDAAALRSAFVSGPTRSQQVLARAWVLGERLGLQPALAR
ncbi:MAG: hypothetical protein IJM64_03105, partial [Ottowia sp.]|nr:hypothetical protein [Ottowia sp.]